MSRRRNLLLKRNGNGNRLPSYGLLRAGSMVDTVGTSIRPNQLRQYGTFLNGETLTSASIIGTETVISSEGTCTPVVSAGTITFDAGTCWNIVLSNGSTYSHPTKTGAAAGIWFDRSGAGIHLTVNVADIDAHITEAINQGSNTLELQGYTVDTTTYSITALIPLLSDLSTDCLGNTPTYTGRAKYSLTPKNAPCATFDGVGDYITLDSPIVVTGDCTFSMTFHPNAINRTQIFFTGIDSIEGWFGINTSNQPYFNINGALRTFTTLSLSAEETSIVFSRIGSNYTCSLNGSSETILSVNNSNITVRKIGLHFNGSLFISGKLFNLSLGLVTFPLSESEGTTVYGYDSEGNNYTGTVTASDIGAFWGTTQDSFFHDFDHGWELSGSVRIPGNPYTGLSCAGNSLTTQPYQLIANDWSLPATGELRDADDIILADTASRFIYDTNGETPLAWSVDDITGGFINDQIFYGKNKISLYDDAQIDPALTKIKKYHGIS